jgi:hypothetical protein
MSFELEGTFGVKKGLRMMYAFESRRSGNTQRVPSVGPVSLWIEPGINKFLVRMLYMVSIESPHSKPSLKCSEGAGLIRSAIKRGSSVQATFKSIRVVMSPIAIKYILETFPEERVFPSLNRSSYEYLE